MSENLKALREKLMNDPEIRAKERELRKLPPEEAQEALTALAGELGIGLTEDDLAEVNWATVKVEELSDSQMENVSGGMLWLGEVADDGEERDCVFWYHGKRSCCQNCGCLDLTITYGEIGVQRFMDVTCTRCKITERYGY